MPGNSEIKFLFRSAFCLFYHLFIPNIILPLSTFNDIITDMI